MSPTHNLYRIMHFVYLLKSLKDNTLYLGCTSNLKKRIIEHNQGKADYSQKHIPWKLVYFEGYYSKTDAFGREQKLKLHAQGMRRLKDRLQHSLSV